MCVLCPTLYYCGYGFILEANVTSAVWGGVACVFLTAWKLGDILLMFLCGLYA